MSRLSDILGVKDDEPFTVNGYDGTFAISEYGGFYNVDDDFRWANTLYALCDAIESPETIIPVKRTFSDQEKTLLNAIGAKWITKDSDGYVDLWVEEKPEKDENGDFFISCARKVMVTLNRTDLFTNIKKGECVEV